MKSSKGTKYERYKKERSDRKNSVRDTICVEFAASQKLATSVDGFRLGKIRVTIKATNQNARNILRKYIDEHKLCIELPDIVKKHDVCLRK